MPYRDQRLGCFKRAGLAQPVQEQGGIADRLATGVGGVAERLEVDGVVGEQRDELVLALGAPLHRAEIALYRLTHGETS